MRIISMEKLNNGAHFNQSWPENMAVPDGYAAIPEGLEMPNYPFGEITVEGGVVVSWTPLPIPEPTPPAPSQPTQLDRMQAQLTYTAMKTGTLIPEAKEGTANG